MGILEEEEAKLTNGYLHFLILYTRKIGLLHVFMVWNGMEWNGTEWNGNVFYAALVGRAVESYEEFGIRALHLVHGKSSLKE